MTVRVVARSELAMRREDDIVVVRGAVRDLARRLGFDQFATAAVTTAASELSRNVWSHGGGGDVTLEELADGARVGLRVEFRDQGPGIADVQRVLAGGYSSASSLGLGLSGSRRLVDDLEIETKLGAGTVVRIIKWARF